MNNELDELVLKTKINVIEALKKLTNYCSKNGLQYDVKTDIRKASVELQDCEIEWFTDILLTIEVSKIYD